MSTTEAAAVPNQKTPIIVIGSVLLVFNIFFIGLRCWTRATISRNFNFNDVFMITAVFVYGGLLTLLIFAVKSGVGGHTIDAGIIGVGNSLKFIFSLEIIYVILTSVMKASLAFTLLQWARKKVHIYLLYAAVIIDVVICLVVFFYLLLQCQPISYAWEYFDPTKKGRCLPTSGQISIGLALSGTTVSLDMLFLTVPFFMLVGRGVNKRLKMHIFGVFGLGVAASVANFIRLAALVKLKSSSDPLFDAAPVFLWSAVEVSIGISAAGIIELRPLMRRLNVKGFEDSFDQLEEEGRVRLQSINKSSIGLPFHEMHSRK